MSSARKCERDRPSGGSLFACPARGCLASAGHSGRSVASAAHSRRSVASAAHSRRSPASAAHSRRSPLVELVETAIRPTLASGPPVGQWRSRSARGCGETGAGSSVAVMSIRYRHAPHMRTVSEGRLRARSVWGERYGNCRSGRPKPGAVILTGGRGHGHGAGLGGGVRGRSPRRARDSAESRARVPPRHRPIPTRARRRSGRRCTTPPPSRPCPTSRLRCGR